MAEAAKRAKAPKRSKENIFIDKAEKAAKLIAVKYDELRGLASKGGFDAAKVTALFKYIDARGDAAAEAFKGALAGSGPSVDGDFSLLAAVKELETDAPADGPAT